MYSLLSRLILVFSTISVAHASVLDKPLTEVAPDKSTLSVQFLLGSELNKLPEQLKVTCEDLIAFAATAPGGNVTSTCNKNTKADLVIKIEEDLGGDYIFDFNGASWRIKAPNPEETSSLFITKEHHGIPHYVRTLVHNALAFHRSQDSLNRFFLEFGARDSKKISFKDNQFYKLPEKEKVSWKEAYKLYVGESNKSKNYMRTSLEMVLILSAGTAWYYRNFDFNAVDFDHPTFGGSMHTRFTSFDALRQDNNGSINRSHLNVVGPGHYLFARSNGLSRAESYLTSFITSTMWEYFVEFREVVSINDVVMTPLSGYVLGEVIYNLSRLFKSKSRNQAYLGNALNPIAAFHKWLDSFGHGKPEPADSGFDANVFGHFDIYLAQDDAAKIHYGADAEILDVPVEEGKSVNLILDRTVFNNLYVKFTNTKEGFAETVLAAKASVFFAYHAKNLFKNPAGNIEGYSIIVGPTQGVDISYSKDQVAKYQDMIMTVQVIGNTIDVTKFLPQGKMRLTIDTHGTYSQLRSIAFEEYRKDHDVTGVQSTLVADNNYFAFGHSALLKGSVSFSAIEIGAAFRYEQFYGINKRTRFLETETNYLDLSDARNTKGAHVKITLSKNSFLKCGYEYEKRSGNVNQVFQMRKERTRECSVSYSFR